MELLGIMFETGGVIFHHVRRRAPRAPRSAPMEFGHFRQKLTKSFKINPFLPKNDEKWPERPDGFESPAPPMPNVSKNVPK